MKKYNEDVFEIDFLKIARNLINSWLIIGICSGVCAVGGYMYSKTYITPLYRTDIKLYVNNNTLDIGDSLASISTSSLSASRSLVDTYIVLLKSRTTLNEVIRKAKLNMTTGQLSSMISASAMSGTEVLQVSVSSTSPRLATLVANTIAHVLPDRIDEIIEGSSSRIVDYAVMPTSKYYPTNTQLGIYGALVGFGVSCAFIILRTLIDDSIKSDEDLISTFSDIPVLAVIPNLSKSHSDSNKYKGKENGSYYYYAYKKKN